MGNILREKNFLKHSKGHITGTGWTGLVITSASLSDFYLLFVSPHLLYALNKDYNFPRRGYGLEIEIEII